MGRLPIKTTIIGLGAAALVGTAVFAASSFLGRGAPPAGWTATSTPAAAADGTAASGTAPNPDGLGGLKFAFDDPAIVEIPDTRPNSYSFKIQDQTIGVIALTPGGDGSKAPGSFAEWYSGIGDTVDMGGQQVPVLKKKVADRDVLEFQLQRDNEVAENLMVEIDGQVLWLQGRASRDYIERFVEKVSRVDRI